MTRTALIPLLLLASTPAAAGPAVPPGRWDVTTTVVDAVLPGVPGFFVRMMRGKSRAEHKRLSAGQGVEALIAPDPKAKCRIDSQSIADGRYAQTLSCPQKKGEPLRISRVGSYDGQGIVGTAAVTGTSTKGPMRMTLSQRARRIGD
ncbi:DUF3617 family protein [Sphingomonas ginsenosidivorax]|uniref:DUF3617 family protein n=1 Tax=Sphingomonas ginsenosidivorax TaxID=862135 RepID=A0A5C6UHD8_9SPHN|nr:DUF3617 family protein [Sphingomonas ginsenosidivorax]TXC71616.1 DUF3617 family protein [Sphingomonas ginsenosidivorax]